MRPITCLAAATSLLAVSLASAGVAISDNRDVQIRSIDFGAGTIELFNYGPLDIDLSGARFCSHDSNDVRRYTAAGGFNGVTIEAGTSVTVYIDNDAPANADSINRSTLGGSFALPLDQDAYGLQIYLPTAPGGSISFGNSSLIADHLQWNINGEPAGQSAFRTGQAVGEGLWTNNADFIATTLGAERIELTNQGDGRLHGPANYTVTDFAPNNRDLQIRSIDFTTGVIELFNFGPVTIDLSGARFCTHDDNEGLRYSGSTGFNGVTIAAGNSVFVHFDNDAPAEPNAINRAALGGAFATPLDQNAYGMQIFLPAVPGGGISFGNSSLIADHLQWKFDAEPAGQAATRATQAVAEGLWSATTDFITTELTSTRIDLLDVGGTAHGPDFYEVTGDVVGALCGDSNCDGVINTGDIDPFVEALLNGEAAWDALIGGATCPFLNNDINGDGVVNTGDIDPFVAELLQGTGCP